MHRLIFFIPFLYSFKTRMNNDVKGVLNWISQFVIPIALIIILTSEQINWIACLINIILLYDIYEIGYIENDTETIKLEAHPTLRLSLNELEFYRENRIYIYTTRLIIAVMISILLLTHDFWLLPISLSWSILFIYLVYNRIRNLFIYPLHFLLMIFRYMIPILAATTSNNWQIWVLVAFMYPTPSIIVKLLKKNFFKNKRMIQIFGTYSTRYLFVVKYFVILDILSFIGYFSIHYPIFMVAIIIFCYYSFRSSLFYFFYSNKKEIIKNQ